MLLVSFQVSLPHLRCLDVPDALIDKLISKLIVNSMSDFGSNGHLHPILHACVASLIMNMMEMLCATSTKRTETEAAPSSFMLNYVNR